MYTNDCDCARNQNCHTHCTCACHVQVTRENSQWTCALMALRLAHGEVEALADALADGSLDFADTITKRAHFLDDLTGIRFNLDVAVAVLDSSCPAGHHDLDDLDDTPTVVDLPVCVTS